MSELIVYVLIFGGLALWASLDAKHRIAAGARKRRVGGGPASVFIVIFFIPILGGLFYLYKRNKEFSSSSGNESAVALLQSGVRSGLVSVRRTQSRSVDEARPSWPRSLSLHPSIGRVEFARGR